MYLSKNEVRYQFISIFIDVQLNHQTLNKNASTIVRFHFSSFDFFLHQNKKDFRRNRYL